jgi:NAD(P)-dependent dehydrogenase (short-subunit alcohol dehydrogenase family)
MRDFAGKVAVVTGGASGIGRAIAERCARERMRLVVADVEAAPLESTAAALRAAGADVVAVVTDVSKFESVQALERAAVEAFGKVHVLCNNAGVGAHEDVPVWELPLNDWRWTLGVNLWGVIHGVKAFLPGMLAHGEDGHVVNTSSGNGGLMVIPTTPIYATSKSAVSALTEALHYQLVGLGAKIKASVLYPGPHIVASNIFTAARNRLPEYARETPQVMPPITLDMILQMAEGAGHPLKTTQPAEVAEHLIDGLRHDRYFILPASVDGDRRVRERTEAILARRNPEPPRLF